MASRPMPPPRAQPASKIAIEIQITLRPALRVFIAFLPSILNPRAPAPQAQKLAGKQPDDPGPMVLAVGNQAPQRAPPSHQRPRATREAIWPHRGWSFVARFSRNAARPA